MSLQKKIQKGIEEGIAKERADLTNFAFDVFVNLTALVLSENYGYKRKRLSKVFGEMKKLLDKMSDGEVTLQEIKQRLKDSNIIIDTQEEVQDEK